MVVQVKADEKQVVIRYGDTEWEHIQNIAIERHVTIVDIIDEAIRIGFNQVLDTE